MAELGLGGAAPAPKKSAPTREQPSHYSTVPNKQAVRTDDVDDIMAELGLGDTRGSNATSQYGNVPLAPKSAAGARAAAPKQQQQAYSGSMYKQVPKASSAESEVDDLLADLGLGDAAPAGYSGARGSAAAAPGGYSTGPGRGGRGGGVSSGPGGARGRGGVSSGPGGARGGISSGPGGARGGMSSGPGGRGRGGAAGAGRGGASSGPGRVGPLATHTADGREIQFTGPPCAACEETIIGAVTNALDKQYHPDCFACVSCQTPFGEGEFLVHEGQPFCDACYNELFAVRCVTCSQPVTGRCIEVGDKKYHVEHFCCSSCGTPLAGKPYKEDDGDVFCSACKAARERRVAKENGICGQCKQPIIGEYIMLRGQRMHPKHFRCEECGCSFSGGNCHEYEGKLYCVPEEHEILTSRGFMDLDTYEACVAADPTLLVASYDAAARAMVFEAPAKLVTFEAGTRQLVELSDANEIINTWAAGSDSHGFIASDGAGANQSSGVSLLVTKEHDLFAQHDNGFVDENGKLFVRPPTKQADAPHAKIKAAELLSTDSTFNVVRQLAVAEAGVVSESEPAFFGELGIVSAEQRKLFFELYGFWLGDGTLQWRGDVQQWVVMFGQVKQADSDWLLATLRALEVHFIVSAPSSAGQVEISLQNDAWNRFFAAEYKHKYVPRGADVVLGANDVVFDEEDPVDGSIDGAEDGAVDEDAVIAADDAANVETGSRKRVKPDTVVAVEQLKQFASFPDDTPQRIATALRLQHVRAAVAATNSPLVAPAPRVVEAPVADAQGKLFDAVSSAAGSYMAPEGINSAKWFACWVWRLGAASLRHIIAGLCRADGSSGENRCIWTSSARFRDEIQRVCLMSGYTARFNCRYKKGTYRGSVNGVAIVATTDSWAVYFAEADRSPSGQKAANPSLFKARGEIRERQYTGRVWCFNMPSGFIWVRRVAKDKRGVVTKASRPLLTGNCKEDYLKLLKDICSFCHKPIIGRSFTALGRVWHPEHFVCNHCVPEDHEILTNRGFLSLDQYTALCERDAGLLVASYDSVAAAMTFEQPQQLVVKPAETQQLVELSSVHEMLGKWSPTSDAHGRAASDKTAKQALADSTLSNHVSLLVTTDHHIYGQYGNTTVQSDGELAISTERSPATKLPASAIAKAQIAKRGLCATSVRQFAAAVNGVKGASEELPPVAAELGLKNEADFVAFLALYGFWLGDGTMVGKYVTFHQVKEEDVAFLRSTLEQLQVECTISDAAPYYVHVANESWSKLFLAEYGHCYASGDGDDCELLKEIGVEDGVEDAVAIDSADERVVGEPSQSSIAFVTEFVGSTIDTDARNNAVLRTAAMYERSLATAAVPLVAPPRRELPTPGVGARGAYDLFSSAAGSYMAPEGIKSAKWFASWVWSLPPKWIRVVIEGVRRADGALKPSPTIYTSSARFRDEVQRLCLLAGYTSHFSCHYARGDVRRAATADSAAIVARFDAWAVEYGDATGKMGSSQRSAAPVLHKARGEIRTREYTGRVWCFTMPSGFIWVRRVGVDERGVVTKASRPLLTGNCKEPLGTASYMEKDGQPYCELHWHALFGSVCARCDKAIMGGVIRAVGKNFHQACFTCSGCDGQMTDGHYEWETKAMCKKCFMKLPADVRKRIETKRKEQLKAEKAREKASS